MLAHSGKRRGYRSVDLGDWRVELSIVRPGTLIPPGPWQDNGEVPTGQVVAKSELVLSQDCNLDVLMLTSLASDGEID